MKHKVAELDGVMLDAAVAKADDRTWELCSEGLFVWGVGGQRATYSVRFQPSTVWDDGGPIIDRERISVTYDDQGGRERGMWNAYAHDCDIMCQDFNSALIAAMRAYVASKFGEEVELP